MAINFLIFCTSSGLAWVLGAGAASFGFAAGVGSMYTWSSEGATGSGLFLSWVVALGSKSMGFG